MLSQWKKYFFTINDIYGCGQGNEPIPKADITCYFQQPYYMEPHRKMTLYKKVKTLCIDLDMEEEQLRKEMHRTTRYEINKAGWDNLSVLHIETPTREDVKEFMHFFNTFAREKGIAVCREAKIESLRKNNQLVISCVYHRDGRKLASHLMIADGEKAFGLYSASIRLVKSEFTKAEIGRANRYLHWKDILFFKQKGYRTHDFLGLSSDGDNKPYQNINQFKKGFGGREEISYNSYVPQTKKGYS